MQTTIAERVRFVDLRTQTERLRPELLAAITGALDRCDFILGEDVDAFEAEFAEYCGVRHAVGVDSGTSALELALHAAGVGPGHEVITQANTFIATVGAILAVGAEPVLVDCDLDGAPDFDRFEAAITQRTRALLPVHLFGRLAPLGMLVDLATRRRACVIEDACQAHGARLGPHRAGSFGLASAFSFYPGKNLGAFGDGGAVTTDSREIASKLRALRNIGQKMKYVHELGPPMNRRLDTLQAGVLRVKLRHLDTWNAARIQRAARYHEQLAELPLRLPPMVPDGGHVYHLFVIQSERRDRLKAALEASGVDVGIHYPIPTHLQPSMSFLGHRQGAFPIAERLAAQSLSLPMYPELPLAHVDRVARTIREHLAA